MAGVPFNPMYASQRKGLVDNSHAAANAARDPLLSLYLANTYGYRPAGANADYSSPDWIPDYSEDGVRAMRARQKYLFDMRYEDVTKEQLAERDRLSAALKEVDGMKFNLGETVLSSAPPIGIHKPSPAKSLMRFQRARTTA